MSHGGYPVSFLFCNLALLLSSCVSWIYLGGNDVITLLCIPC